MSRATRPHRALLLLAGALVALAGIVWAAVERAPAPGTSVGAAPVAALEPAPVTASAPAAAGVASAATPVAPPTSVAAAPTTVAGSAGMRIFRDPETGEIGMPAADPSAVLELEASSEDQTGLTEVQLPDGSFMVDLEGRFQETMVIKIDANGKRVVTCGRDMKKMLAQAPTSTTSQREER